MDAEVDAQVDARASLDSERQRRRKRALAVTCGALYTVWIGYLVIVALFASR